MRIISLNKIITGSVCLPHFMFSAMEAFPLYDTPPLSRWSRNIQGVGFVLNPTGPSYLFPFPPPSVLRRLVFPRCPWRRCLFCLGVFIAIDPGEKDRAKGFCD